MLGVLETEAAVFFCHLFDVESIGLSEVRWNAHAKSSLKLSTFLSDFILERATTCHS